VADKAAEVAGFSQSRCSAQFSTAAPAMLLLLPAFAARCALSHGSS
jgi:hypothetical protein